MLEKIRAILGVLSLISVLVLCITMPLTAFSITDYKLLGGKETAIIAYQSTNLSKDDFYILNSLNLSYEKRSTDYQYAVGNAMYTNPNSINNMNFNSELTLEVEGYLKELNKAGAVPENIIQDYSTKFRNTDANGKYPQGYYSSSASGIALINVYLVDYDKLGMFKADTINTEQLLCALTIDVKSNKVLSLLYLSSLQDSELAFDGVNECFIKYLGLDVAQDWEDISDLRLAEKSIYSPSLGTVSMLEAGYGFEGIEGKTNYFSLKLMPVNEEQISLRRQYNDSLVPHPIDAAEDTNNLNFVYNSTASSVGLGDNFYIMDYLPSGAFFTKFSPQTREKEILCDKLNCDHNAQDCEAIFFNSVHMPKVFLVKDKIYLIEITEKNEENIDLMAKTQNYNVRITNYNPDTKKYEIISETEINNDAKFLAYDDNAVYINSKQKRISEEYDQIVRLPLNSTEKSQIFGLAPGERITGTYGKYFVTSRKEGINDNWAASNGPIEFYRLQLENTENCFSLLKLDTQKRIPLQVPSNSLNLSSYFFFTVNNQMYLMSAWSDEKIAITLDGKPYIIEEKMSINKDSPIYMLSGKVYFYTTSMSYTIDVQTGVLNKEDRFSRQYSLENSFGESVLVFDRYSSQFEVLTVEEYKLKSINYK